MSDPIDIVERLSYMQHNSGFATAAICADALAELTRLRADFAALQHALVGDTGASAILTAQRLRAALAQPAAPGWQLVPVEPTRAMLEAFFGHHRFGDSWLKAYRDMLAAAPQAPAPAPTPNPLPSVLFEARDAHYGY